MREEDRREAVDPALAAVLARLELGPAVPAALGDAVAAALTWAQRLDREAAGGGVADGGGASGGGATAGAQAPPTRPR